MVIESREFTGCSFFRRAWKLLTFFPRMRYRLLALEQKAALYDEKTQALEQKAQTLEQKAQTLEQNHAASVAWLQKTYPEIVTAIGRKLEVSHLEQLTQDLFAAIHRETGVLSDRLRKFELQIADSATNSAQSEPMVEDSRISSFYLELERCFRGTQEEIAERVLYYLPLLNGDFETHNPVLDLGCGRGEWLRVATEAGFSASGVDSNPINGDYCRTKKLLVTTEDALQHLAQLSENTIGTVSAFHLVEHLAFSTLLSLTDEIHRVLKPGGLLIYETPNPENLLVATHSFWIDPTHIRPLPPELLRFLVTQRGFTDVKIHRLHPDVTQNSSDETLQALLSCPRDYAIVAHKPRSG